jgi:hypothetical protein
MGGGSGKTSYRDDIYVIRDFSSGSGVSTSASTGQQHLKQLILIVNFFM